jgi:hypothetical protein
MIEYKQITRDILEAHKWDYIQLGGHGILNGLKSKPCKNKLYKIEDVEVSGNDNFETLYLRQYRCTNRRILPAYSWNQACRIFTKKEYKHLPINEWRD